MNDSLSCHYFTVVFEIYFVRYREFLVNSFLKVLWSILLIVFLLAFFPMKILLTSLSFSSVCQVSFFSPQIFFLSFHITTCFEQFDYYVLGVIFYTFLVTGAHWASQIYRFIFFITFGKFLTIFSNYLLILFLELQLHIC